ncbi:MAG: hypothetical protein COA58_10505 [Bacteroidetes bacterium]|nr:MAG: hypothetical protein COA58_10505 [Bacteroidota bacterium]
MCIANKTKGLILFLLSFTSYSTIAQSGLYAIFDASQNSYIDLGVGNNLGCLDTLSDGDSMTITLSVRWTDLNGTNVGNWANLFTASDSTGSGDNGVWWVQHNNNNTKFEFALHTSSRTYIQSTTKPVDGTWYHLAMTYDGSTMKLYVNGNLESSRSKTGNIRQFPAKTKLNIGRWANPGNAYRKFCGNIDNISVWNCALSASQIDSLRTNPTSQIGASCDTAGLIGYWNFNNNTADDMTPCGNNGEIGSGTTLPVELIGFNVTGNDDVVQIQWQTASEINNDYFKVEKSTNGTDWEIVSEVTGAGNSSQTTNYKTMDLLSSKGLWYYRLSQTDFDGTTTYSEIRAYLWHKSGKGTISIYPNPTKQWINIVGLDSGTDLKIADVYGKNVTGAVVINEVSHQQVSVNLEALPPGIYVVQLPSGSKKIVKQ